MITGNKKFDSYTSYLIQGLYSTVSSSSGYSSRSSAPSSLPLANHLLQGNTQRLPREGQSISTLSKNQAPPKPELSCPILKFETNGIFISWCVWSGSLISLLLLRLKLNIMVIEYLEGTNRIARATVYSL